MTTTSPDIIRSCR